MLPGGITLNKLRKDAISGMLAVLFGIAVYLDSLNVKSMKGILVTSAFFPQVAAVLLVILGTILIIDSTISNKSFRKKSELSSEEKAATMKGNVIVLRKNAKLVLVSIVLLGMYIVLLEPIGFLIATSLYVFFQIFLLAPKTKRRKVVYAIIAAATSIILYVIFVLGLSIILPPGILDFI